MKQLILLFSFFAFTFNVVDVSAQTKSKTKAKAEPVVGEAPVKAPVDTILGFAMFDGMTPFEAVDYQLPAESETDPVTGKKTIFKDVKRRNDSIRVVFKKAYKKRNNTFYVATKRPVREGDKMKLCINIINKDTNLLYCVVDSVCKDPEFSKIMFEKQKGDSVYMLIYVYAFSKLGGNCNGEKEAKLFFTRWNVVEGRAIWKNKHISSCAKTITNMTKTPIEEWDGKSVLTVNYHRGTTFHEIFFDPEHPELGIQSTKEGAKSAE
ncbi:MAG TPA: hypothetical protein VN026_04670 [Bacteroidia bacterium]|jgi:hypothetical protein|nr:hypothetical protein [Bacteroidia bacterium]